jgi:hypothetical protein
LFLARELDERLGLGALIVLTGGVVEKALVRHDRFVAGPPVDDQEVVPGSERLMGGW